ncbi:MotA/TolQ/ExbB proton channel family protein [Desulfamplus magnetovallimortis]|nr:MotA/TolQ/ExbB proton channel family protein [Desulfamplus magnetovallimortis]
MRGTHLALEEQKSRLRAKAIEELEKAREEARLKAEEIRNDRNALKNAVEKLKQENEELAHNNQEMEKEITILKEEETALSQSLEESIAVNRELAGLLRSNAKDLENILVQSLQSALSVDINRHDFLKPMIDQEKFPSMADIRKMASILFDEISASGEVRLDRGMIVDRQGVERVADLLIIGNFTAIYSIDMDKGSQNSTEIDKASQNSKENNSGRETGFLLYSDQSQRLFALSKLPEKNIVRNLVAYMKGEQDDVYMDISKGAAIRQLTHQLSLREQIPKGGPIVWPIVAILGIALVILVERIIFFLRKQINADKFMKRLEPLVRANRWDDCRRLLESSRKRLIPKVLLTAMDFRDQDRADMENALQEAILNEIPRIERFLSTLGMLAAIAPLLGLLGTVTGMINTFHAITSCGTGDPRMMSGGISEALVTTMLGLSVAIPVMLVHTILSRHVETEIGKIEEKSVSFVNMIFKNKNSFVVHGKKKQDGQDV